MGRLMRTGPGQRAIDALDELEAALAELPITYAHRADMTLADIFKSYTAHARGSVEHWERDALHRQMTKPVVMVIPADPDLPIEVLPDGD